MMKMLKFVESYSGHMQNVWQLSQVLLHIVQPVIPWLDKVDTLVYGPSSAGQHKQPQEGTDGGGLPYLPGQLTQIPGK